MEQSLIKDGSLNWDISVGSNQEKELLETVCVNFQVNVETINRLINLEKSMIGKRKRRGLQQQIETIIQAAIMAREEEEVNVIKESGI
ncbi:hypothetical protein IHV09_20040 [Fictibacillus sp. 23RED33]|uniref:hypothetical protein n=1 Tax=Fictibacillus sp. 23RED33 TaxID=2745879 RepID=UPI0018CF09EB|nr:hypothetical protein [Fictibacillus sp. 23RED33]MBH0175868.1 hypothetical protein [Fictibacillus sp. 23RED33]